MLINDDGLSPCHGELVICDMCGKTYKFFVWAFGSDKHLCMKCVHKRPAAYLDNIDAIDSEKEQRIIDDEIDEQDRKDNPKGRPRSSGMTNRTKHTGYSFHKAWKRQEKLLVAKFRKETANDVGLG